MSINITKSDLIDALGPDMTVRDATYYLIKKTNLYRAIDAIVGKEVYNHANYHTVLEYCHDNKGGIIQHGIQEYELTSKVTFTNFCILRGIRGALVMSAGKARSTITPLLNDFCFQFGDNANDCRFSGVQGFEFYRSNTDYTAKGINIRNCQANGFIKRIYFTNFNSTMIELGQTVNFMIDDIYGFSNHAGAAPIVIDAGTGIGSQVSSVRISGFQVSITGAEPSLNLKAGGNDIWMFSTRNCNWIQLGTGPGIKIDGPLNAYVSIADMYENCDVGLDLNVAGKPVTLIGTTYFGVTTKWSLVSGAILNYMGLDLAGYTGHGTIVEP